MVQSGSPSPHWPVTVPLVLPTQSSFESIGFNIKFPFPITVLLVYRPPKPNAPFIPELHNLLTTLCTTSSNLTILGDINIHVHISSHPPASDLLQLLDCLHLTQHINAPTHDKGRTLDMVISSSRPGGLGHLRWDPLSGSWPPPSFSAEKLSVGWFSKSKKSISAGLVAFWEWETLALSVLGGAKRHCYQKLLHMLSSMLISQLLKFELGTCDCCKKPHLAIQ